MKKFRVTAQYTIYLETDIEAEDEDQAWQIANDLDGSAFDPVEDDNWTINDVMEKIS